MIARQIFLSVVSFLTVFGLSLQAWSSELSNEYLLGKWVIQGTDCSDPGSEFVIFRDSGAVEAVRAGNLEAAGFWEISDEIVVFHVAASPAFFHGARQASENVARHRLILNTNDGQNLCVAIIRRATS